MIQVQPKDIDMHWLRVMPLIESAIEGNRDLNIQHIRIFLLQGTMSLFLSETTPETVAVVEFVQMPSHKLLRIVALAGKNIVQFGSEWSLLKGYAKKNGCDQIEALTTTDARHRLFSHSFGFSPEYLVIRADL